MLIPRVFATVTISLLALAPAQAVEALSKAEMEAKFVGSTITFADGRRVTLSRDGVYSSVKLGKTRAEARYTIPSGNILQINWGPRNEQRDLFYRDKDIYYVVDRWGRRSDIVSVQQNGKLASAATETPVETTGSLDGGSNSLQMNLRVEIEITPEMIDAGVQVLTSRRVLDDGPSARSTVERMFREMMAARQRQGRALAR
ncbi:MAG: hypothetical protein HXY30_19665 [Pseudorhodoplanes sp.]|nr:hypothetical protein [Pseudorhodoplanes sp.]